MGLGCIGGKLLESIDQAVRNFISEYLSFIPEEYWAVLAIILTITFLIIRVATPVLIFINTLRDFFKPDNPIVPEPPLRPEIRVLRDVWLKDRQPSHGVKQAIHYRNTNVLTVLNMKGGVGKTTVSANLGAALHSSGNRVLFIDYDYQGTLSLMISGAVTRSRRDIGAASFMTLYPAKQERVDTVFSMLPEPLQGCAVSGASYQLFRDEMEQFALWSSGQSDVDVRVQLRDFLNTNIVQEKFDFVIIDCGPRFTTSTINALCSSTHFLVPTILDEASAQAVSYLEKELSTHRADLFPQLKCIGVVPTMISYSNKFAAREKKQIDRLSRRFADFDVSDPVMVDARIPRKAAISTFANKVAYYEDKEVRDVFDEVSKAVLERLN